MRALVALLFVGLLFTGGLAAYEQTVVATADGTTVVNESFSSPTAGEVIQLENSNQTGAYYAENETVRDENGTVMDEGADYEWLQNGTLRPLEGGDLAGDASGEITYHYDQTSQEQRDRMDFVALLVGNAGTLLLVGVLLVFMVVAGGAVA